MNDPLEAELARWLAEANIDEAVAQRLQERAQRQLASDEATFLGLCLDLAEARRVVLVRTAGARVVRGTIVAVGTDFLVLRTASGEATILAAGHLVSVRPAPGAKAATARPAAGDRRPPLAARLVDVLHGLAGERPRVRLALDRDPDALHGRLRACGADVVSVELLGETGGVTWVPLRAVLEVGLLEGA